MPHYEFFKDVLSPEVEGLFGQHSHGLQSVAFQPDFVGPIDPSGSLRRQSIVSMKPAACRRGQAGAP
jgi:hypothetical protein